MKRILGMDLGASSGRAMLGGYDGDRLSLRELYRFENRAVDDHGTLRHDLPRFMEAIKHSVALAAAEGLDSLAIDTWGVDFGLIGKDGAVLQNPVHYRDDRTVGIMEEVFKTFPKEELYRLTGLQHLRFNTVFQLAAMKKQQPELLERTDKILFMPDLLTYMLTGRLASEYTVASTSQMLDAHSGGWSDEVLERTGIDRRILCEILPSGSLAGRLKRALCHELGVLPFDILYTAGHDTASAFAAVPDGEDSVYISSGTWSIMGFDSELPIINELGARHNFANEGAAGGKIRFLKNIAGMWPLQECRREWGSPSYAELEREAAEAGPFACFADLDDERFTPPGDMQGRIREYCRATGQMIPETRGEMTRCLYESLALRYREVFELIRMVSGRDFSSIRIVGGGAQAELVSQFAADACGVPVVCGPTEATALGNIAVQLIALGELENLSQARTLIGRSVERKEYLPRGRAAWDDAYARYLNIKKSVYDDRL